MPGMGLPGGGGGGTAKAIGTGIGSFLGPVGGVVGNLIGGLFGSSGQSSANQANLQIARENREWQERMSNTAHQRAAADLEKAGLNRILALGKPSSTPAGNIATMQNEKKPLQESITSGITTALQARRQTAEIKLIEAQAKESEARAGKVPHEIAQIATQMGLSEAQTRQADEQVRLIQANEQLARHTADNMMEQAKITKSSAEMKRLEAELYEALYSGDLGKVLYFIKELAIPIAAMGGGAAMLGRSAAGIAAKGGAKPGIADKGVRNDKGWTRWESLPGPGQTPQLPR